MIKLLIKKDENSGEKANKKMNIDVNELEVMEDIASLAVVTGEEKRKYLL